MANSTANPGEGLSESEIPLAASYQQRRDRCAQQAGRLATARRRVAQCRTALLIVAGGFVVWAAYAPTRAGLFGGVAVALFGLWMASLSVLERIEARWRYVESLGAVNEQALARLRRAWDQLPLTSPTIPESWQALANDLDLFGRASLFHLICQAHTPWGIATLRDWLLPATPPDVGERQQAVAALADERDWREEFAARGRLLATGATVPLAFAAWAESGTPLALARCWAWKYLYPALMTTLVALFASERISADAFGSLILLVGLSNLILCSLVCGGFHDLLRHLGARGDRLSQYRQLLELASRAVLAHPAVAREVGESQRFVQATAALGSLQRILYFSRLTRLPMIWLPVQLVTLWDFHIHALLERWRRRHGAAVRAWLEGLGTLEALSSLAALKHDNPAWCFATMLDGPPESLRAEALAHPLQRAAVRVANDVALGPRGSLLMVTGSNMTGKSTLLRSLGVNLVLAQAGGPVCARRFETPRLVLAVTIRVRDSLEQGISLYMAELLRLRQVLEQARTWQASDQTAVLFLLDEILQGTNTAERQIAARAVILELLRLRAFGAVSTHDLDLARDPQLAPRTCNVHFSEQLSNHNGAPQMHFDYRLRPGVTPTTNALRLLEAVGLPMPHEEKET